MTLEHRLGSGILGFFGYVSLPFTGSSSFAASILLECIHRFLTAVPYNTMQHEAGCQPEAATANAASTSTSSNGVTASARQALIVEVPITLPTYTPDQKRMMMKHLAFRAWKASSTADDDTKEDEVDDSVTASKVLFPERWKTIRSEIKVRREQRSLELSFPTLEYHTLPREAVQDEFWIGLRNMQVTEGMLEQLLIHLKGDKLVVEVQGPSNVLSLLEENCSK